MIAFLLADLRDWRKRRMRKTILLSAIVLAAVGLPVLLSHAGAQRALGQGLRRLRLYRYLS